MGKKPLGVGWQQKPLTTTALQKQLLSRGKVQVQDKQHSCYEVVPTGIAVICGQNTSEFLIAIDCDGTSAHNYIATKPLPPTIAFTSGRPGRAQYLFKISQQNEHLRSRKITTAPGEALEFRGSNLASVLPPSIHPLTGSYRWLPGCRPDETEVAVAPDWVVEQMSVSLLERSPRADKAQLLANTNNRYSHSTAATPTGEKKAVALLEAISTTFADDYYWWVRVGMALKSVSPNLLNAWDNWSQQSIKYKPGECEYKWNSFRGYGISIGTLYYLAKLS